MDGLPEKILAAVDGGPQAEEVARMAANLAAKVGSELHVVHVGFVPTIYHPEMQGYPSRLEAIRQDAQQILDEQAWGVEAAGAGVTRAHLRMDARTPRSWSSPRNWARNLWLSGAAAWVACVARSWAASRTPSSNTHTARSWW